MTTLVSKIGVINESNNLVTRLKGISKSNNKDAIITRINGNSKQLAILSDSGCHLSGQQHWKNPLINLHFYQIFDYYISVYFISFIHNYLARHLMLPLISNYLSIIDSSQYSKLFAVPINHCYISILIVLLLIPFSLETNLLLSLITPISAASLLSLFP